MTWAYGVTTVPARRGDLLPRTLASLKMAGFDQPTLFVDGAKDIESWEREFGLHVEAHARPILAWGNWLLSLYELYIRNPQSERYAIFQDDVLAYRNLREYLEGHDMPAGYWNLYAHLSDQSLAPAKTGWYQSRQSGRGALGLVFSHDTIEVLLRHEHTFKRPMGVKHSTCNIDGGVVSALSDARSGPKGWKEYCHNPPLLYHAGHKQSVIGPRHNNWPETQNFRGAEFDALDLVKEL